ncbi:hypothetical protein COO91_10887 (plasmid) [Nostoc flagelliforme CCNUN1]|uniref:Uncharacterized protein n=1 Tax=Nostoc flagelliforme CCNUN1 TaxID=2038116 RepID=A0A2K8TAG5_9NOSO|nr:hypothetical protein COO91_10887 [Nostoc flagelliforme CCNUN1]
MAGIVIGQGAGEHTSLREAAPTTPFDSFRLRSGQVAQ